MARKKQNVETYEEREGSGKVGRILGSMALYGVMLLLGYIVFATPEAGTGMGAIRDVLCGLGGVMAIVIPLFFGWIATLMALKAAGKKVSVWKSILDGVLWLCVFTAAHLFVTEDVIRNRMTIHTFANFVNKSYAFGAGGGAIGSLMAWPLYSYLGKWGGVLGTLLLALLSLTATGRMQRFIDWSLDRMENVQHDVEQHRMVKENERMFDYDDPKPVKRRQMDPASDEIHLPDRNRAPQPARRNPSNSALKRSVDDLIDNDFQRPRDDGPSMAAFDGSRRRRTERAVETDVPESVKKREAAKNDRVKKLADEEIEHQKAEKASKKKSKAFEDMLIDIPEDPVETPIPEEPKPAPKPVKLPKAKKTVEEGVQALRLDDDEPKKKKETKSYDDDLTIEPEQCDVLENDDPPFDMPDKKPMKKLKRPAAKVEIEEEEDPYNYPPIDLLEMSDGVKENHREADMEKAQLLEDTLKQFGISTKLTGIAHGPAVTRFELQPAPGVKVSRISSLQDDIAMHLAAMSVRIEAPIPGKAAVGVEIPNEKVEMVRLRDVLESPEARKSASKIAVGLGKDNAGRYIVADIAKMPHVLIAGQTGSGKSVCINSIITSILFRATPDEVKLILIDPKMVELSIYNDIPHLVCPVVTDCKKAASALDWAVAEMSMRYKRFSERGVRDIKGYNKALEPGEKIMPQMVIIIDELADLMMVAPGEVEDSICRLAQLARAAGMHLVIATQRPSVNVITGIIKANIPTRIAFSVASQVDSRTMIDHGGAEKLLGNGDMLFVPSGINKPMRVQGAWVSDEEVHAITNYIKERSETSYDADMIEKMDNAARSDAEKEEFNSEYDPRLPEAVEIVVEAGQASVSMLQRRMRVGYARAGRLIDEMEQRGIVSEADGAKPRTVLITREEMNQLFEE